MISSGWGARFSGVATNGQRNHFRMGDDPQEASLNAAALIESYPRNANFRMARHPGETTQDRATLRDLRV